VSETSHHDYPPSSLQGKIGELLGLLPYSGPSVSKSLLLPSQHWVTCNSGLRIIIHIFKTAASMAELVLSRTFEISELSRCEEKCLTGPHSLTARAHHKFPANSFIFRLCSRSDWPVGESISNTMSIPRTLKRAHTNISFVMSRGSSPHCLLCYHFGLHLEPPLHTLLHLTLFILIRRPCSRLTHTPFL
jgi:hypothetical protein